MHFILGIWLPPPSHRFCIPPNPALDALRLHAELNLYKLRTCRNITGMERQVDAYAAATDTQSGMPMIGAGGQLTLPGTITLHPRPYRYATLIERAKQLVQLAAQIEAAMLAALEKRDAEAHNLLKARQDLQLAQAGVQLQDLRVREADDGVKLAELQRDRASIQVDHYQTLLTRGLNDWEVGAAVMMGVAAVLYAGAALASAAIPGQQTQVASLGASAASATSQLFSLEASYERRQEEWEFQLSLAQQDVVIGNQQVQTARDQVRIVGQERIIAQMQASNAETVVNYLSNKFTNAELYDWMSGILGQVYSFFLQQATAMANLAENQLAFERQQVPPPFIQANYWVDPADSSLRTSGSSDGSNTSSRQGLTGSARLLEDIYQLDQYAFDTNKRKLQLTKTISLLELDPSALQSFRETGVITFATPMSLFDRDFPGHYLRLIRRVRTSMVALIPPNQGIRATLSNTGTSRVVIGGDTFQTALVRRDPESVALTSPRDATGLFELDTQPEMLLPFEGSGVDTTWELRMPKAANRFDYSTIADVLLTIEYTALNSYDYQQQVLQTLSPTVSANRPFSFVQELADQWYDMHNPDQTATPMVVSFQTVREDFPPNIDDLRIQQIALYFARSPEPSLTSFRFTALGESETRA